MQLPDKTPKTIEDWQKFMNGYRDPKTLAEMRKDQEFWDSFTGQDSSGSGQRECGSRKEGGTYATCPLSKNGMPLEHFIVCKPVPVVPDDYNLSNVGVKLVDIEEVCLACKGIAPTKKTKDRYVTVCPVCHGTGTETVTHVFDIVGQEYYPNVADFLEEARRMGVSRRLELEDKRQYARLSTRSRLMLLHHKAVINNPSELLKAMGLTEKLRLVRAGCPKSLGEHESRTPRGGLNLTGTVKYLRDGCSALYWHVLEGAIKIPELYGVPLPDLIAPSTPGHFMERGLASGSYRGYSLKADIKADFSLGIFVVFPIVKIDVVDPDGSYADRVERAGASRLDVEAVGC